MKALIINLEAKGEDSSFKETYGASYVMAVFDGLGGVLGGKEASFHARNITQNWFQNLFKNNQYKFDESFAKGLQKKIESKLKELDQIQKQSGKKSSIRGSLAKRSFSTTMALVRISSEENAFQLDIAWIGDSRIYFLSAEHGLQQLTKDDLKEDKDAFHHVSGSPISKTLSAKMESDWEVNFKSEKITESGLVIACTDGCFDDLRPWELEQLILDSLFKSENEDDWQTLLIEHYIKTKSDDVTLLLCPIKFDADFSRFKEGYQDRYKYLESLDAKDRESEELSYDKSLEIWEQYRTQYEARLGQSKIKPKQIIETKSISGGENNEEVPAFLQKSPSNKEIENKQSLKDSEVVTETIPEKSKPEKQNENKESAQSNEIETTAENTENGEKTENKKSSQGNETISKTSPEYEEIKQYLDEGHQYLQPKHKNYVMAIGRFSKVTLIDYSHIEALSYLGLAYSKEADEKNKFTYFNKDKKEEVKTYYELARTHFIKVNSIFSQKDYLKHIDDDNIRSNIIHFIKALVQVTKLEEILVSEEERHKIIKFCSQIYESKTEINQGEVPELRGRIYQLLDNKPEAIKYFELAQNIYQSQDKSAVKRCQYYLNSLKPQRSFQYGGIGLPFN
jgi:Serine/threonine protein phosphatase